MNFDIQAVVKMMLQAAEGPLEQYGKTAPQVAKDEFTKIAQLVEQIGIDRTTQTITVDDAKDRLEAAKQASICAFNTQAGLAEIAAEDAINAALGAVSSIINGYLGLALI